MICHIFV